MRSDNDRNISILRREIFLSIVFIELTKRDFIWYGCNSSKAVCFKLHATKLIQLKIYCDGLWRNSVCVYTERDKTMSTNICAPIYCVNYIDMMWKFLVNYKEQYMILLFSSWNSFLCIQFLWERHSWKKHFIKSISKQETLR